MTNTLHLILLLYFFLCLGLYLLPLPPASQEQILPFSMPLSPFDSKDSKHRSLLSLFHHQNTVAHRRPGLADKSWISLKFTWKAPEAPVGNISFW